MYSRRTGLILGFHGTDESVVKRVLNGDESLKKSTNDYDWLGNGIYFWENSPSRVLEFAKHLKDNPSKSKFPPIEKPAVIGAVLNLGFCLDLLDYENLQLLKAGYEFFKILRDSSDLPKNKSVGHSEEPLLRFLDCAVIQSLYTMRERAKNDPFDSARGVFKEGKEVYPGSGFKEKDHIQICITNINCIKGFFLPRTLDDGYEKV